MHKTNFPPKLNRLSILVTWHDLYEEFRYAHYMRFAIYKWREMLSAPRCQSSTKPRTSSQRRWRGRHSAAPTRYNIPWIPSDEHATPIRRRRTDQGTINMWWNPEQVLQLADEVECIFLRHFAGNDRKVAMKYLKPQQPRNTHMITFLVGE